MLRFHKNMAEKHPKSSEILKNQQLNSRTFMDHRSQSNSCCDQFKAVTKKAEVKMQTMLLDFMQDHIDDDKRSSPSNTGTVNRPT